MSTNQRNVLEEFFNSKNIVVLTGAGISAESGLPTFRDKDGYWIYGSENYHPMELATESTFQKKPEVVWDWYHHRRNLYGKTDPNKGHQALVELEKFFTEHERNFTLVTQNVDSLHRKAGSSPENMYEIHGNIFYMRCFEECTDDLVPIPDGTTGVPSCPNCGKSMRPHVLWMDEFYDEEFYKFRTVLDKADRMDALLLVGTTLQTNLPRRMFEIAYVRELPMIEVNLDPIGMEKYGALELKGKSGDILPELLKKISI